MPRSTSACSSASGRAHEPPSATATTPSTSASRPATRAASCFGTVPPLHGAAPIDSPGAPRHLARRVGPGAVPGRTTDALGRVAREVGAVVIAPLFERRAAGVYHNTVAVLGADGALVGLYRKMHIPDDPLFYEKFYFTPGDLGFRAFDTAVGR